MSRRRRCECCCMCGCSRGFGCGCGCNRGFGNIGSIGNIGGGCGCCGFDPCRLALFLLVLRRANIIDSETGTILIFLFLLCCGGFKRQGICC
ncbi:hypothetical protein RBU49_11285 [Clostridium sp. MB40-C1]|uniref:hypothetical protein n=1 Tax=Clostridium sp. MB40-C1 TaxID=3070996 RepID=UPI0027E0183C|nr:hypothetical protein [Clostridium sp. MB40-C1]WMJ79473.1 hypothetical protein RBU49_11285 [Clostridium sp. MB40-C1]